MQFQTPQFLDIENKIVGPLTIKQFLFLAGAGGLAFILFFFLKLWLWFIFTVFLGTLGISFAFIKYNSQPLYRIAWLAFNFFWKPRVYLWQREKIEEEFILPEEEILKPFLPAFLRLKSCGTI